MSIYYETCIQEQPLYIKTMHLVVSQLCLMYNIDFDLCKETTSLLRPLFCRSGVVAIDRFHYNNGQLNVLLYKLCQDIAQLIDGDLTLVGERGVTLSGGQKARVNLARAVYRDAEVYLLDDPLSAVDTAVARHLFDKCIRGLLGDRVVVLVTHQLHFALQTDKILALKDVSTPVTYDIIYCVVFTT